jgi:hypothetical protein
MTPPSRVVSLTAAVALISGLSTSCSEERGLGELKSLIRRTHRANAGIMTATIRIPP